MNNLDCVLQKRMDFMNWIPFNARFEVDHIQYKVEYVVKYGCRWHIEDALYFFPFVRFSSYNN